MLNSKRFFYLLLTVTATVGGCTRMYTGDQLSQDETKRIKELGRLDEDEKIYQFYSNNEGVDGEGNFYTAKRIGHYWNYQHLKELQSARYQNIVRIAIAYHPPGDFVIPFLLVTRKDSTQFKIYVDGEDAEAKAFFNNCRVPWKQSD